MTSSTPPPAEPHLHWQDTGLQFLIRRLIKRHLYRFPSYMDADDLMQEFWLIFNRLALRYNFADIDVKHAMALFKTAATNYCWRATQMANWGKNTADLTSIDDTIADTTPAPDALTLVALDAPDSIRESLAVLLTDQHALHQHSTGRRRYTHNESLVKAMRRQGVTISSRGKPATELRDYLRAGCKVKL